MSGNAFTSEDMEQIILRMRFESHKSVIEFIEERLAEGRKFSSTKKEQLSSHYMNLRYCVLYRNNLVLLQYLVSKGLRFDIVTRPTYGKKPLTLNGERTNWFEIMLNSSGWAYTATERLDRRYRGFMRQWCYSAPSYQVLDEFYVAAKEMFGLSLHDMSICDLTDTLTRGLCTKLSHAQMRRYMRDFEAEIPMSPFRDLYAYRNEPTTWDTLQRVRTQIYGETEVTTSGAKWARFYKHNLYYFIVTEGCVTQEGKDIGLTVYANSDGTVWHDPTELHKACFTQIPWRRMFFFKNLVYLCQRWYVLLSPYVLCLPAVREAGTSESGFNLTIAVMEYLRKEVRRYKLAVWRESLRQQVR